METLKQIIMSNNTGNTLVALITGAIVGAGVGLLYAPQSGKKTRHQIKEKASDAKDKLSSEYDKISDQVSDFAESTKEKFESKVDSLFKKASSEADGILASMEVELEELRQKNAQLAQELEKLRS